VQSRKDLVGVLQPGGRPIHISTDEDRKKIPDIKDFYVDLFLPKAQIDKLVRIGDPVTLLQDTYMIGDAICGKAMDNRVSLWTGINAIRKAGEKLKYDTYFVACVQEEVGLRGAMTRNSCRSPRAAKSSISSRFCRGAGRMRGPCSGRGEVRGRSRFRFRRATFTR
jgi:putative aminopeptidase FrvX